MKKSISDNTITYIISRILENAESALNDSKQDSKNEFKLGRREAYYEVLDTLKSELSITDADLKNLGIDIDIEKMI
ncbi:transposase [Aminicella lysinilytica]|uniref:Transposase n=1 Tax=Aminicella lysinilytica TaxID=433323 RepID=A0A4R6QEG2_9FIRM|nr:transposase [Aminicella lysinilytica]TDP59839.1 hypothetical protein EV211_10281 [Aminicella lysinilytica]